MGIYLLREYFNVPFALIIKYDYKKTRCNEEICSTFVHAKLENVYLYVFKDHKNDFRANKRGKCDLNRYTCSLVGNQVCRYYSAPLVVISALAV